MIIAMNQFGIEKVAMTENSSIFKLSHFSPLLQCLLLSEFVLSGELPEASQLVNHGASLSLDDISQLLSLFHKTNVLVILYSLTHEQWSSHW